MRSFLRKLAFVFGALVALLLVLLGLACWSPVQTWVARRVLPSVVNGKVELESVKLAWNTVHVSGLKIDRDDLKLDVPAVDVEMPLAGVFRDSFFIKNFGARGWRVELKDGSAGAHADATAASGAQADSISNAQNLAAHLFDFFRLPDGVRLGGVDLDGAVDLSAGRVTLTAARPAGSAEAIGFSVNFKPKESDAAPISVLRSTGELSFSATEPNKISRLGMRFASEADTKNVAGAKSLSGHLDLAVEAGTAEIAFDSGEREVLRLAVADDGRSGLLSGTWKMDLGKADLSPYLPGVPLPASKVTGEGTLSIGDSNSGQTALLKGTLVVDVDGLESIDPHWGVFNATKASARFDVSMAGGRLRVQTLDAEIETDQSRPLLDVAALQAFLVDLGTWQVAPEKGGAPLARIKVLALPLAWANPWLPEGMQLAGELSGGQWSLAQVDGGLSLQAESPLQATGLGIDEGAQSYLRGADASLAVNALLEKDRSLHVALESLRVGFAERPLLTLTARAAIGANADAGSAFSAEGKSDLGTLAGQAFARALSPQASGQIAFSASGKLAKELSLKLGARTENLGAGTLLPNLNFEVDARKDAEGRWTVAAPLALLGPDKRLSDLRLDATLEPRAQSSHLTGKLVSENLFVEDGRALAALLRADDASAPPATGAGAASPERATAAQPDAGQGKPFWKGYSGTAQVDLKRVVLMPGIEVNAVAGSVTIGEGRIDLSGLRALFGKGGSLQASALLGYSATDAAAAYSLGGEVKVQNFDPGPYLKILDPKKTPVIEGRFDFDANLDGRSADMDALWTNALAHARLVGGDGVLRLFSDKITKQATVASLGLGLLGGLTGNATALRYSTAAQVARQLAEFPFKTIRIDLSRGTAGELAIQELSLDSDQLRLLGSGGIGAQAGQPLWRRPLDVSLQLEAKGLLATGLGQLNLLGKEVNAEGYVPLKEPIRLSGSLAEINADALQNLIDQALR